MGQISIITLWGLAVTERPFPAPVCKIHQDGGHQVRTCVPHRWMGPWQSTHTHCRLISQHMASWHTSHISQTLCQRIFVICIVMLWLRECNHSGLGEVFWICKTSQDPSHWRSYVVMHWWEINCFITAVQVPKVIQVNSTWKSFKTLILFEMYFALVLISH